MSAQPSKPHLTLISPPSRAFNHYRPPIALLSLAGYLLKHKIKVKIIDIVSTDIVHNQKFFTNLEIQRQNIEQQILDTYQKHLSSIVGITCYTPEYREVLNLARKIKKINPKVKIIVGGIHPTLYPDELLLEPNTPVDFEIMGEGEETLLELVKKIINKSKSYSSIKGLAYRKNNQVIKTPLRPLNDNLDDLYYPAYHLIDMNYYTTASPYAIRGCFLRSFYLLATRGCPSTCTFCVAKKLRQFNGGGKYTRVRSAKNLIKEIKLLKNKYKIDSFYFIDDLLTINHQNLKKFCQLLIKSKLHLLWGCSSKVSTLNEKIIKTMAAAGCIQIDFGVERGSDMALNLVQKGISVAMIKNIFALCHQYHIRTFTNFLINLPGETTKDLKDIVKLAKDLKSEVASINIFCPYPGTEIYDHHRYHFSKEEYSELFNSSQLIKSQPHKYRFASHKVDLLKWADKYNHKYNQTSNFIKFHLTPQYLKTLFLSNNKLDYLKQLKNLLLEFINQKYA